MSQIHEPHEVYMKRKLKEENIGVNTEYTNMRLTAEIEQLKNRIKQLETDMAYNTYATSPEEQRIYDLRRTD
jgi:5,10-methylene-tetrahydrofolate dehydrogenase/methenyl tetrahydrofolate cyclohydrolase